MKKLNETDKQKLKVLIILLVILGVSLTALYIQRSRSYIRSQRIPVQSGGVTIQANLLYPTKRLSFQDKRPLLIYCHGIGQQMDFDIRIPVEFTKRGFYVAALDYQGQGNSQGNIANLDPDTGIASTALDCSNLLDKIMTMPVWNDIEPTQVGIIGHSMGGNVMLQNQALDDRFTCVVGWAPLVNWSITRVYPHPNASLYDQWLPVNLINENNTENLLIIGHVEDEALDWQNHFVAAQQLTGCDLINITEPLALGNHQLYHKPVYIYSINWFEEHWFGSTTINGPISISFWNNYLLLFINIGLIVIVAIYFTINIARFFGFKTPTEDDEARGEKVKTSKQKLGQIGIVILSVAIFLITWELFNVFVAQFALFFASLALLGAYAVFSLVSYYMRKDRGKFDFKEMLKYQFEWRPLLYSVVCGLFFLGIWMMFTWFYPFMFVWPSRFGYFLLGVIVGFPLFLALEILFRRIIFRSLAFTKYRTLILILIQLFMVYVFMQFTNSVAWIPSVLFMYIMVLIIVLLNTFIYRNTRRFSSTIIVSFIIVAIFFGAVYSNLFGVGSWLYYMTGTVPYNNIFLWVINWW